MCRWVLLALDEKKFLAHTDKDEWPAKMATLRSNTPRSTTLDEDLTEYTGNGDVNLSSLLDAFRRHFLKLQMEAKSKKKISTRKITLTEGHGFEPGSVRRVRSKQHQN